MSRLNHDSTEMKVALEAVSKAAEVCRAVQADLVTAGTLEKKDKSPVTVADFASQAVVCSIIAKIFPGDPVVGEEDAADLRGDQAELAEKVAEHAGMAVEDALTAIDRGNHDPATKPASRYWTLDPIDGTKGFLRGQQYAVALGLIEDGKVVLSVLGCPNLDGGLLLSAVLGGGTRVHAADGSSHPVSVSTTQDPAEARFCESVESGHSDQGASAEIAKTLGITAEPYRIDSQCKYAAVARGDADIYLRLPTRAGYQEKIWDHAAGMLCVTEAGGTVTDITGKPLDFSLGRTLSANSGIIATNGAFHDRVVEAVQAAFTVPA
ncbi:MAG: 3'(2'),5'-bisphosphate nucleotidase [Planctomycetota bacterium]